ncbi:MAG: hypothetical protein IJS53_05975, partial [Clostridia bacterium]|nr:hypothetical protein [Clostridia bacterium]
MTDFFDPNQPQEQPAETPYVRRRRSDRHKAEPVPETEERIPELNEEEIAGAEEIPTTRAFPPMSAVPAPSVEGDWQEDTIRAPGEGSERSVSRVTSLEPPAAPEAREEVPVYGEVPVERYSARSAALDERLYPDEADDGYDDGEDEPPRRGWLAALIAVLLVLVIFAAGIWFLPSLIDRPKDGGGFAGSLYNVRDRIVSVLGLEQKPAEIHLFQAANTNITVGGQAQFSITTTGAVENVCLTDDEGALRLGTVQCKDPGSNTTWILTVLFDEPYAGDVYATVMEKGAWRRTDSKLTLLVTAPTPTPTLVPTATPTPTPTPTPTVAITATPGATFSVPATLATEPVIVTEAPTATPTATLVPT